MVIILLNILIAIFVEAYSLQVVVIFLIAPDFAKDHLLNFFSFQSEKFENGGLITMIRAEKIHKKKIQRSDQ